jgi:hypothetical protein
VDPPPLWFEKVNDCNNLCFIAQVYNKWITIIIRTYTDANGLMRVFAGMAVILAASKVIEGLGF